MLGAFKRLPHEESSSFMERTWSHEGSVLKEFIEFKVPALQFLSSLCDTNQVFIVPSIVLRTGGGSEECTRCWI